MVTRMSLRKLVLALGFGLCVTPALAQGGGGGTVDEQKACKNDAIRFCREAAAAQDNFRVLACLQANRAKISKACQAVLTSHGQ